MRLLHVINSFGRGGAENHLLQLVRCQAGLGHNVSVAYFKDAPADAVGFRSDMLGAGARVLHLDAPSFAGRVRQLRRAVHDLDPELVHSHLPWADFVAAVALRTMRQAARPRFVISVHNRFQTYERPVARMLALVAKRFAHAVYETADALIAISNEIRRELVGEFRVDGLRVHTVYYGIELPAFNKQPRSTDGRTRIVVLARLVKQKGLDTLIEALAQLPGSVHLSIVGNDYGEGPYLAQLTCDLGVAHRVSFEGFRPDAAARLVDYDVFCLPSRWEGFGLVLLEAGAAGLPVVATDISPINEIVISGETGLLVPVDDVAALRDALGAVASDVALAQRLAASHRRRVELEFTALAMTERVEEVYGATRRD